MSRAAPPYAGRAMCACTKLTAIDPSPTGEATRLTDRTMKRGAELATLGSDPTSQ